MSFIKKNPMIMIVIGVIGISLSAIFVKYSTAPSDVTAAYRMLWTVLLMTPVTLGKPQIRQDLKSAGKSTVLLSLLSGVFLAVHFALWFESLQHTSVASSTTIVCTEVIWVSLGYCLFMKGKVGVKAIAAIGITLAGSVLIAFADAGAASHLKGDILSLLSAWSVAVYTLIGRKVRKHQTTAVYTYFVYLAAAGSLLLLCIAQRHSLFAYGFSPAIVGLLLAVFSTILGHSIFSWCLRYFSPSFVSATKLCEPVVAAILAGILFAQIPTVMQALGGILILGGVLFYSHLEQKQIKGENNGT